MILVTSGTLTADGTEQQLSAQTPSVAVMYMLKVSAVNMLSGDAVELRAYTKLLSTGNAYECELYDIFNDAQSVNDIVKRSIAIFTNIAAKFTLKQTVGTFRTFKWELYSL